jgi:hypothetical protein
MPYPPLLKLSGEDEYRQRFLSKYCIDRVLATHDGILVKFREHHFKHAFYQASGRQRGDKSVFSRERAERIDWIETALTDSSAEHYVGYDNRKKRVRLDRRVSVSNGNYVVVIQMEKKGEATFVTAFCAGPSTLAQIRSNPKWPPKANGR